MGALSLWEEALLSGAFSPPSGVEVTLEDADVPEDAVPCPPEDGAGAFPAPQPTKSIRHRAIQITL